MVREAEKKRFGGKLMPYVTGGEIVHAEVLKNTEELKEWVKKIEG